MGSPGSDHTDDDGEARGTTNRRRFLVGLGSLGVVGFAGCTGDGADTPTETDAGGNGNGNGNGTGDTDTPTATEEPTPTATSTSTPTPTATPEPAEFPGPPEDATLNVLVISVTKGFRHGSIPSGNEALQAIAGEIGGLLGAELTMDIVDANTSGGETEYPEEVQSQFPSTVEGFREYDCVVFQNTTGEIFEPEEQQPAFKEYIQTGGGWMGIHAGSDTHEQWPWFQDLAGAWFAGHPAVQEGVMDVEQHTHPSTKHLGDQWTRTDEWYDFTRNPREVSNVLLSLDESTYEGGSMGDDHPIAWYHSVGDGRSFYTGGGHTSSSFDEPMFREHLKGGLMWAAGYADVSPAVVSVSSEISLEDPIPITNEQTLTMTVTVGNRGSAPLTDGQVLLGSNAESITTSPASGSRFDSIEAGGSHEATWEVTISPDAEGEYTLPAVAIYTSDGTELVSRGNISFTIQ